MANYALMKTNCRSHVANTNIDIPQLISHP